MYTRKRTIGDITLSQIKPKHSNNAVKHDKSAFIADNKHQAKLDDVIDESTADIPYNIAQFEHVITPEEETHIIRALTSHFVFNDFQRDVLSLVLNYLI